MKTKAINITGRYMSTYSFVGSNDLHDEAENLFGVDWEAEDDVNQIQTLLDAIHPNEYYVSLIPDCKYEDDILVTLKRSDDLTMELFEKRMIKKQMIAILDSAYSGVSGLVRNQEDYETIDIIQPILDKIDEVQNDIEDI